MKICVSGIGIWTRGFHDWPEFLRLAANGFSEVRAEAVAPAPPALPPRERRRAPLPVRLAVEVAHQACEMAGVDKTDIASVFTSAMGDTDITEYMCRALAAPVKMLSPTRFHNSVHNAPSGYWSISAGNRAPSSYAGSFHRTVPVALLEAATLCEAENRPVLLVVYDIANGPPFHDICPIAESFAAALVLDPDCGNTAGGSLELAVGAGSASSPEPQNLVLAGLAATNPAARCLPLLEALAAERPAELRWPLGTSVHLAATVNDSKIHQPCATMMS
ncbi:hypothetical protein BH24PSE2_BH24PSE2_13960 [soil metagenome]